jgi:hypothetical protein
LHKLCGPEIRRRERFSGIESVFWNPKKYFHREGKKGQQPTAADTRQLSRNVDSFVIRTKAMLGFFARGPDYHSLTDVNAHHAMRASMAHLKWLHSSALGGGVL